MSKLLTIHALLLLLCGCGIGITPWGDMEKTFESPYLRVLKMKGRIEAGSPMLKNTTLDIPNIEGVQALKQYWGEPDERLRLDENTERWKYTSDSFRWHGALLYILFIPIPVLIPFGHDYSTVIIDRGELVSGTHVKSGGRITFFCGLIPFGGGYDASLWRCDKMKP